MKRIILLTLVIGVLLLISSVISCDFSPKLVLEPPFDTVIPKADTLLAAPKLVSEGCYKLPLWEGDGNVPLFQWDGEGEAPIHHSRVCEGNDMFVAE